MVAGVIIGVATQDIEDQPAEQLLQGGLRILEAMADDFGQLLVTGVGGHHFVQFKQGQRRHHGTPVPIAALADPVKALDQQYVLAHGLTQLNSRHVQAHLLCQSHGDEFGFNDAVQVVAGRELGDELALAVVQQHLGASATQRRAVQQSLIQLG
jgi:hypothetical protein